MQRTAFINVSEAAPKGGTLENMDMGAVCALPCGFPWRNLKLAVVMVCDGIAPRRYGDLKSHGPTVHCFARDAEIKGLTRDVPRSNGHIVAGCLDRAAVSK